MTDKSQSVLDALAFIYCREGRLDGIQEVSGSIPLISTIEVLENQWFSRTFAISALLAEFSLLF